MNLNNFTIKAQEILQYAQQVAFNHKNPNIETSHLLEALLADKEGPIPYLLKKNNVSLGFLERKLDEQIEKLPKIQGSEPAQVISREGNNAILRAGAVLKEFGDEFVTPEHLLIGLVQVNDDTTRLLKDAGLTEKGLISSIKELRKGNTVSSQTESQQYHALQK
ncbi:MAG: type VI secretion system ATPase TssH, partial [Pedobacter sp.]